MDRFVNISVPFYVKESLQGKKAETYYVIHLEAEGKEWDVKRKFADFIALKKSLSQTNGAVPALPPKTWFFSLKTEDQFDKRREGLDKFVKECSKRSDYLSSQVYIEFMEVRTPTTKKDFSINNLRVIRFFNNSMNKNY